MWPFPPFVAFIFVKLAANDLLKHQNIPSCMNVKSYVCFKSYAREKLDLNWKLKEKCMNEWVITKVIYDMVLN